MASSGWVEDAKGALDALADVVDGELAGDAPRVLALLLRLASHPVGKLALLEAGAVRRLLPLLDCHHASAADRDPADPAAPAAMETDGGGGGGGKTVASMAATAAALTLARTLCNPGVSLTPAAPLRQRGGQDTPPPVDSALLATVRRRPQPLLDVCRSVVAAPSLGGGMAPTPPCWLVWPVSCITPSIQQYVHIRLHLANQVE